jgi:hypothetical protein
MDPDDVAQFFQLLGYSVAGYGDLDFIPKATVTEADDKAEAILAGRPA